VTDAQQQPDGLVNHDGAEPTSGPPRWVKVFGTVAIIAMPSSPYCCSS